MSRVIKFRAWYKERKQMVRPHDGDFIKWHAPCNWKEFYEVMQFTGLTDCNGVEIYDGDIIENPTYDKPHSVKRKSWMCRRVVEWIIDTEKTIGGYPANRVLLTAVAVDREQDGSCEWSEFFQCKVIGNIYEHPHLLDRPSEQP